jgi:hypothetical protein
MIRKLAPIALVLGMGAAIGGMTTTQTGCGWWSSNSKQVVTDVGQIASCVIGELFQNVTDPLKIAAACVPATAADVEQIIASIINFYDQPAEAGAVAASDKHCGVGQAPYKGLEQCVTSAQLANFKTAHDQAKAQLAGAH